KHLNPFVGYTSPGASIHAASGDSASLSEGVLDLEKLEPTSGDEPISVLGLGTRALNCCENLGITTVGELAAYSKEKIASAWNAGDSTIEEIEAALGKKGLSFNQQSAGMHP
ncbi:MAG: DNA-directed RNA polymerase subunit alpha C-terminal domain-containing protein, partial [Pirellulales bacterium]